MHRRNAAVPAARLFGAALPPAPPSATTGDTHPTQHNSTPSSRTSPPTAPTPSPKARRSQSATPSHTPGAHAVNGHAPTMAGRASRQPSNVIELVAQGHTNDQVVDRLLMSPTTVKTHLTHVFAMLGVANRTELAAAHANRR